MALATALLRYAVVDLATAESLRPALLPLRPPVAETLFQRDMPERILAVGPWLVNLGRAPDVAAALAGFRKGFPWGYYLHSDIEIMSLRHALRKFNLVELAGQRRPVLFRYWDPRVMRDFLQIATSAQKRQFTEWIARIESADGSFDLVSSRDDD
jgi:hypothetical protein